MIYTERSRVPIPEVLIPKENQALVKEYEEAEHYYRSPEQNRGQRRFTFRIYTNRNIKLALQELFYDKCCYCEVKLDKIQAKQKYGINGDIEHFRPKSSVLEAPNHPGYWWLAANWDNLFIACQHCNRGNFSSANSTGKANRFPLENENDRAYYPESDLSIESPLLLNPCKDNPSDHLVFAEDGRVYSDTLKGKTSILVHGLNRGNLVEKRKKCVEYINSRSLALFDAWRAVKLKSLQKQERLKNKEINFRVQELNKLMDSDQEFAGLKRQLVENVFDRLKITDLVGNENIKKRTRKVTSSRKQSVKKSFKSFEKNLESLSISSSEEEKKDFLLINHYVERIELKNIKTFVNQIFDFTKSNEGSAPWMMLLGENGTGKSTVLKSLSLNLSDSEYFLKMIDKGLINPNRFIRHNCSLGIIKVWLTGMKTPRVLELRKNRYLFISPSGEKTEIRPNETSNLLTNTNWKAKTFLLGYGATRLLPRNSSSEQNVIESKYVKVDNLFNPFVPLGNAEKWLKNLSPTLFRRVAIIFKDLLNMGEDENLEKGRNGITINLNGIKTPFHEMSDGYQSVIALTADVLKLAMTEWKNPDEARGIVILDEVGAHLHPQWKMKIVGSLRKALPHMQFIVSSHQPLCLRGIGEGEVMILRRNQEKEIEVLDDLPNPKELRISQILTSVFGLSSTLDPELEKEYNRYYQLRAMYERTDEEEAELQMLNTQLSPDMMLGESLLDVQAYKIVKEEYKSYQESSEQSDVDKLSKNTLSAVQSLWKKKS